MRTPKNKGTGTNARKNCLILSRNSTERFGCKAKRGTRAAGRTTLDLLEDCVLASRSAAKTELTMSKRYHKWVSWSLVSGFLTLTLGLGCGSAADLNAKECCKSICQHRGNELKNPEECCQKGEQSKPSVGAQVPDSNLVKKVFDCVLLDATPLAIWFDDVVLNDYQVAPSRVFKPPQQEIYKLTSAFLI
jgi:hypothetical protein